MIRYQNEHADHTEIYFSGVSQDTFPNVESVINTGSPSHNTQQTCHYLQIEKGRKRLAIWHSLDSIYFGEKLQSDQ